MDVNRAVSEFVSQGRELHHLLRSDGNQLAEAELLVLAAQLHVLKIEIAMIRSLKRFRARRSLAYRAGKRNRSKRTPRNGPPR
jgi:hypothetical protein